MAEIDPVILEMIVRDGEYRAQLRQTAGIAEVSFSRQQNGVKKLEHQMLSSTSSIAASVRGLAGTLAAAFSVREIVAMGDSWSDLSSQVGVAINDMERAPEMMRRISDAAKASYSTLEQTATQFARNNQSLSQMGYTTDQALTYTEALNNALVVTATKGDRARQVTDSLSKAIATGKLEAEDLKNILAHGGAIADVIARKFGVTTNALYKLREEGKITGDVIVRSLIDNFDELYQKAETMPATVSDGFILLKNALTQYIGETDKSLGATERMASALISMSNNLDTIIPALAIIAGLVGVKYVTGLVAATAALAAKGVQTARETVQTNVYNAALAQNVGLLNAQAAASARAAASTAGVGGAARVAGTAIIGAFNPATAAVTALVIGLGYLYTEVNRNVAAEREMELQSKRSASALDTERKATDLLTSAKKAERKERLEALKVAKAQAEQSLINAKNLQKEAQAAVVAAKAQALRTYQNSAGDQSFLATFGRALGGAGGAAPTMTPGTAQATRIDQKWSEAEQQLETANGAIAELEGVIEGLGKALEAGSKSITLPASDGKKKTKKGPRDREDDIAYRVEQRSRDLDTEILRAKERLSNDYEEKADLQEQMLQLEKEQRNAELDNEARKIDDAVKRKELSQTAANTQKAAIDAERTILDELYGQSAVLAENGDILVEAKASYYRQAILLDQLEAEEQKIVDAARAHADAALDALKNQYDLATTDEERRTIALQILDLEDQERIAALDRIIQNERLYDARERQIAAIEKAAILASRDDRQALVQKAHQGPLDRYVEQMGDTKKRTEEAMVRQLQDINNGITDALSSQLGIKNKFVKDMFSIFLDQAIFQPLAEAMRNNSGGGIGGFIASIGSLFGRASGGYVAPGQTVRVNEHRGGAEYLRMGSQGGQVIPLGQVNAAAARPQAQGGGVVRIVIDEAPGFASTVRAEAQGVAIEVVQAAAPAIADAGAQEAMRRSSRPSMGRSF